MWIGLVGFAALVLNAAHSGATAGADEHQAWKFLSVAAVGITVSGAALLIGGLLGFLFGIPRTVASEHAAGPGSKEGERGNAAEVSAASTAFKPSTDLEQIADWLTKILVGVGLTELTQVPRGLAYMRSALGQEMGGNGTFAVGLSLYFVLCGFLIGFLWTRLFYQQALKWADEATEAISARVDRAFSQITHVQERCDKALDAVNHREAVRGSDDQAWNLVFQQLNVGSGLAEATTEDLREAIRNATAITQEKIFHHATMVRSANWNANKELMARTIPIFKAFIGIDAEKPEYHGELGFALKDKGDYEAALKEFDTAIRQHSKGQLVLGAAWYEFQRAMCRIHLDNNFKRNQPSDSRIRQQVKEDLIIARDSGLQDAMYREGQALHNWIKCNGLESEFPPMAVAA